MKLPVETSARLARHWARGLAPVLILVPVLAGCGSHEDLASAYSGDSGDSALSAASGAAVANGPAADYPIVVGEPYRVGAALYTPADTMNYDEVGYAAADNGAGVTGAHHTLPLPSYVEVTSLTTGKTILVRLARRGPMNANALIALSPAAFAQLGASAGEPVRVRRVNPPEDERAALRAGHTAPPRMDTPTALVAVLKRKLPGEGSASLVPPPAARPAALAAVELPPSAATPRQSRQPGSVDPVAVPSSQRGAPPPLPPLPTRSSQVAPAHFAAPVQAAAAPPRDTADNQGGGYVVQAAAMSTFDRAQQIAGVIGGSVSRAGPYFRVRTGPFATREQAEASLAKVRAAGYSDARISTNG